MPVISMDIGDINTEQKQQLLKELAKTASEITQIPLQAFIVVINQMSDDNIGIGGQSVRELKEMAR